MMDYPVNEFILDYKERELSFAGQVWKSYQTFSSCKDVVSSLISKCPYRKDIWDNQNFTKTFGIQPTNFKKIFNACMRKIWIEPIEDVAMMLCFTAAKKLDGNRVNRIWSAKEYIDQAREDGLMHLVPLIVLFTEGPKDLKKRFGKKYWKMLCKNSKTRNLLITKAILYYTSTGNMVSTIKLICDLNIPSSLLKTSPYIVGNIHTIYSYNYLKNCIKVTKVTNEDHREINHTSRLLRDAESMANQLGKTVNPNWSLRKLKEKHDAFSKEILARKHSPEPLPALEHIKVRKFMYRGYTATLLDNRLAIAEEGTAMRHCVAGYTDSVVQGRYLVYSITKDGNRSSTLGISVHKSDDFIPSNIRYSFGQHYGPCNKYVTDLDEKDLAEALLSKLNGVPIVAERIRQTIRVGRFIGDGDNG